MPLSLSCRYAVLLVAAACAVPMMAQIEGDGVSLELATARASLLSNLRYRFQITLAKQRDMEGHGSISFDLAKKPESLALDYRDGTARNLTINGAPADIQTKDGHVILPGDRLVAGSNRIELDFTSGVAEANRAITRFMDREDGSEYLYSLFVPMDAHQAFPCFDQPDLKGRFSLEVTAPGDWLVVANGREMAAPAPGAHRFEETPPISTYLFAFAAGPFQVLQGKPDALPMRLFVRKAMVNRAREEWPAVEARVREGVRSMSAYFAQPFPFTKYDEVLIPGFPYGGMEHAGATFLNEDGVLFRTVPTVNDFNRRSTLLLHELAHQWFGDLVTMRWFDDLWLKEGFAQFMAYHTLAELEPPALVWKRFYEAIKPNAYTVDGTRGTTPIYQRIRNLKDAKSAYGAIVYSKAPALLRVLSLRIGEGPFQEGVRSFLKEHAYGNADWNDLIFAFFKTSRSELGPWATAWIHQRGMPQIEIDWACGPDRRIQRFDVTQKDVLREENSWPVDMQVLLGYRSDPPSRIAVSLQTAKVSVPQALGKSCPDYVFGNDEDHGYGRFLLDPVSQKELLARVPSIPDPFLRALLLGALWDAVREARLKPAPYMDLALRLVPAETDPEIASSVLAHVRTTYALYLGNAEQNALTIPLESLLLKQTLSAPIPDLRIGAYRSFVSLAKSPSGLDSLKQMLSGAVTIPGVPFRQRDRWNMLATLMARADSQAEQILREETARDRTEDGKKYAYVAAAGRPTMLARQTYFRDYLTRDKIREDWISASLPQFNDWNQAQLSAPFLKPALEALPQMKRERKIFFVLGWLGSFVGGQHSPSALRTVDAFLGRSDLDPDLRLKVLEARDELARTARIRDSK